MSIGDCSTTHTDTARRREPRRAIGESDEPTQDSTIWPEPLLDNITREMLQDGTLRNYIKELRLPGSTAILDLRSVHQERRLR